MKNDVLSQDKIKVYIYAVDSSCVKLFNTELQALRSFVIASFFFLINLNDENIS